MAEYAPSSPEVDGDAGLPEKSPVVAMASAPKHMSVTWEINLERLSLMLNTFPAANGLWAVYDGIHILPMQPDEMLLRGRKVKRVMGWSLWASKDLPVGTCLPYGGIGITDEQSAALSSRDSCYVCGELEKGNGGAGGCQPKSVAARGAQRLLGRLLGERGCQSRASEYTAYVSYSGSARGLARPVAIVVLA